MERCPTCFTYNGYGEKKCKQIIATYPEAERQGAIGHELEPHEIFRVLTVVKINFVIFWVKKVCL
jgi:hypothetical protein